MKEVEAVRDMNLFIIGLDPSNLVDYFVAPLVHTFVAYVHLRVQDPQKTEALLR